MAKRDLALDLFHSFQNGKRKTKRSMREHAPSTTSSEPSSGPQLLKDVLAQVIQERDWKGGIAEGTLFSTWADVVGPEISLHATPISLLEGVLTIQTSSTAWAVQLQLVGPDLLATIRASSPGALVDSLSIIGPSGPSWKKGVRTIRGAKGPRDTYG
jgi:predicted nucleic acid-binding Zn ribbon protein